jgi:hypothetical protein
MGHFFVLDSHHAQHLLRFDFLFSLVLCYLIVYTTTHKEFVYRFLELHISTRIFVNRILLFQFKPGSDVISIGHHLPRSSQLA